MMLFITKTRTNFAMNPESRYQDAQAPARYWRRPYNNNLMLGALNTEHYKQGLELQNVIFFEGFGTCRILVYRRRLFYPLYVST